MDTAVAPDPAVGVAVAALAAVLVAVGWLTGVDVAADGVAEPPAEGEVAEARVGRWVDGFDDPPQATSMVNVNVLAIMMAPRREDRTRSLLITLIFGVSLLFE